MFPSFVSISKALVELHGFIDCDTEYAFSRKENIKLLYLMFKNEIYIKILVEVDKDLDISDATNNIP